MPVDALVTQFAEDVAHDLQATPRRLQSRYLYDALGSRLFEAICQLPWYRITRAEERLLSRHVPDVAARLLGRSDPAVSIVELGAGSGEKLARVVGALPPDVAATVQLVDISAAALDAASARLAAFPGLRVERHRGTYEDGLLAVARAGTAAGRRLLLFLGSNIGNFEPHEAGALLSAMRAALSPGDLLLLGADLVKPARELMLAYDDPLGVTAAFNKNLLVRMNRELEATFDVDAFAHVARWNEGLSRIEMHLVSLIQQEVDIPAAGLRVRFAAGDSIWTESSHKYTEDRILEFGAAAGFAAADQWIDPDARFALTLFTAS